MNNKSKKENFYTYGKALKLYEPFFSLEKEYDFKLMHNAYYIFRFDGKHMSQDYKIKDEPINKTFFKTMKDTLKDFCTPDKKIEFAYSFSDEISILIKTKENINYRLEKLLSLYASELSVLFYKNSFKYHLELKRICLFDARAIKIDKTEIKNYFIARQAFAIDRYLIQLKKKYNLNPQLKKSTHIIYALKKKKINYSTLPAEYRYGLVYHPKKSSKPFEFSVNEDLLNGYIFNYQEKR